MVWPGVCGGTTSVRTSWVSMNAAKVSPPRLIKGSGCVAFDIDLQADRFGNEYLRLGSFGSTQLATRKAGRGFSKAVRLNAAWGGGSGDLSVSNNGLATVVFGGSASRFGYSFVTSKRGGPPSAPKKLDTRVNLRGRRDALLNLAPLPRGRVAMFWSEIWPSDDDGGGWRGLGVEVWHPNQPFTRPGYSVELPPHYIPFPAAVATGRSGPWIAWWEQVQESEASAKRAFWLEP